MSKIAAETYFIKVNFSKYLAETIQQLTESVLKMSFLYKKNICN